MIKGSTALAVGTAIGVTWWQVYDNIYPKTVQEEMGQDFVFSSKTTSLDGISNINFGENKDQKNAEYLNIFKLEENDCVKKYLPGKISSNNIQHNNDSSNLNFNYLKYSETQGCVNINIKYNDDKIIGKTEQVFWKQDESYALIMSSIISNFNNKFNFVNELTILKSTNNNWDVDKSAIWSDSIASNATEKNMELTFGDDRFFFKIENKSESSSKPYQEYKRLARWFQGGEGKFFGHLSIGIGDRKTDLWKDWKELKTFFEISSKLFKSGNAWYRDRKFNIVFPTGDDGIYGKWFDVYKECSNKQRKDICIVKN